MRAFLFGILTILSAVLVFSMDRSDHVPVDGAVSLNGRPIKDGLVMLYPENGTVSAQLAAKIIDGRFHLEGRRGPVPGEYSVAIYEFEGSKALETIPSKFNRDSVLRVQVAPGRKFRVKFDLDQDTNRNIGLDTSKSAVPSA